eukprot:NODE_30515_length_416_cov_3.166090.p2 GENE.NODE_30515_length_416_cov_3.166090~~NODE_30515_length_416_cov_3.166090.p2  ORF type:complete len:71 (+),score=1.10 NODE_30515_length_416_cov_3.166090:135-347(+)
MHRAAAHASRRIIVLPTASGRCCECLARCCRTGAPPFPLPLGPRARMLVLTEPATRGPPRKLSLIHICRV